MPPSGPDSACINRYGRFAVAKADTLLAPLPLRSRAFLAEMAPARPRGSFGSMSHRLRRRISQGARELLRGPEQTNPRHHIPSTSTSPPSISALAAQVESGPLLDLDLPPRHGNTFGVLEPRFRAHHTLRPEPQVGQTARHRPVDRSHCFLARHARSSVEMREAAIGGPYSILMGLTMPVQAAGIRSDPPISVPTPSGLPHMAISEDSPPEEPPEVSARFNGNWHIPPTRRTPHCWTVERTDGRARPREVFVQSFRVRECFIEHDDCETVRLGKWSFVSSGL
ncbi:hypothetical protein KC351_g9 [Hortaea werneckii]|nr:hypothetical protein KC351_g9 [Hortaea werneckii]